jgi:hypothetical protein
VIDTYFVKEYDKDGQTITNGSEPVKFREYTSINILIIILTNIIISILTIIYGIKMKYSYFSFNKY